MRLDRFQQIPEFELHGVSSRIDEKLPNEAGSERTEITVSFHISRDSTFYFQKVLSPVFMLSVLSLHVFLFDPTNISDRVATTATYFLASFAMLYVVSDLLPKTNFLTRIDSMIFLSTFNLLVAGITTVILYTYVKQGGDDDLVQNRRNVNHTLEQIDHEARKRTAHVINLSVAFITLVVYVVMCIYWFVPLTIHQRKVKHDLSADYPPTKPDERTPEPGTSRTAGGDGGDYSEVEREETRLVDGIVRADSEVDLEASQPNTDAWWPDANRLDRWYVELEPDFALKNLILDRDEAKNCADVKQLEHDQLLKTARELEIDEAKIEEAVQLEKSHKERWGGVDRRQRPETVKVNFSYKAVAPGFDGALLYTFDANAITKKTAAWKCW